MLRHSSVSITADTYSSVLPEVARQAAEAVVALVPRGALKGVEGGTRLRPGPTSVPPGSENGHWAPSTKENAQVTGGAPPGT